MMVVDGQFCLVMIDDGQIINNNNNNNQGKNDTMSEAGEDWGRGTCSRWT